MSLFLQRVAERARPAIYPLIASRPPHPISYFAPGLTGARMPDMYRALVEQLGEEPFAIPAGELSPTTTLSELGLDSLALLEMMAGLEELHGLRLLEEDDAPGPDTALAEIASWLESRSAQAYQ
jgi:acyl carrier protein